MYAIIETGGKQYKVQIEQIRARAPRAAKTEAAAEAEAEA